MAYGIMRMEKRSRSAVQGGGLQLEANRTPELHNDKGIDFANSDINWTKTHLNYRLVSSENWNKDSRQKINSAECKERSNSTILLDTFFSASKEYFGNISKQEQAQYFKDCLDFYIDEFCLGDKSLVINAVVHLDETTPHMHVCSVPLYQDEKGFHLSARDICGGRADFVRHQDRFFESVLKERGLERGERRSKEERKKHITHQEWQAQTLKEQNIALNAQKQALEARNTELEQIIAQKSKEAEMATLDAQKALAEALSAATIKKPGLFNRKNDITVSAEQYQKVKSQLDEIAFRQSTAKDERSKLMREKSILEQKSQQIEPLYEKAQQEHVYYDKLLQELNQVIEKRSKEKQTWHEAYLEDFVKELGLWDKFEHYERKLEMQRDYYPSLRF